MRCLPFCGTTRRPMRAAIARLIITCAVVRLIRRKHVGRWGHDADHAKYEGDDCHHQHNQRYDFRFHAAIAEGGASLILRKVWMVV